mgnify:CR=1 FL=1
MSDQGVEAELELHLATTVQTASRNTAYSSSTKSRRDGKDGHLHCMDAHGLRVSAAFGLRRLHVRVQTFCVATLTPRGDPLSASLRALVGEGWEGYDPQRASNSNSSSPKRLPGAEGPPEGIQIPFKFKGWMDGWYDQGLHAPQRRSLSAFLLGYGLGLSSDLIA